MTQISVIITTKNEEPHIADCLGSIKNQTYPSGLIEIIVVDNNSNDRTVEIAKRFTDKVYNHGPERSAQRNFGGKLAAGKYILYLDADMTLSGDLIRECVEVCEKEGSIALYIPERIIGKGFWIKIRDFERSFYNATVIDAVRFVRKDKFLEIGGFDENLNGPEDWDLDRRIRAIGRVNIISACIYHNEGNFNIREYIGKKLYYAKSFGPYANKWGKADPIIKKQLGLFYRYFVVFLENGNFIKLIRHPLLASATFFLRFALGINYILNYEKRCSYNSVL